MKTKTVGGHLGKLRASKAFDMFKLEVQVSPPILEEYYQ